MTDNAELNAFNESNASTNGEGGDDVDDETLPLTDGEPSDDVTERQPLNEVTTPSTNNNKNDTLDDHYQDNTNEANENATESSEKKKFETFEIEPNGSAPGILQTVAEDTDDLDEEAQGLLAQETHSSSKGANNTGITYYCFCCGPIEKVAGYTVFCPKLYARTGWGVVGPHWFGPPCAMAVLLSASSFFIRHGWTKVGPITGSTCIIWTVVMLALLINTAYRDPGIVREETPTKNHRWCEFCKNYQPPKGAHCPDCNVCIAGYDQYVHDWHRGEAMSPAGGADSYLSHFLFTDFHYFFLTVIACGWDVA